MSVIQFIPKNKQSTVNLPAPGNARNLHVSNITEPEGGWEPAGYNLDGSYVVLSRKTGQFVTLGAQDLEEKKLLLKLGQRARNSSTVFDPNLQAEVFDIKELAVEIAQSCDDFGRFDHGRVRGPGLYREVDDLVINFGEKVATSSGRPVCTVPRREGAVYQSGMSLGFSLDTPCATDEEVNQIVSTVNSFGLRRAGDSILILGWLSMAFFGQVLSHRPILAITAERGSGKTTLIELLSSLLGPQAMRRDGVPTVAQIIYELENKSAALMVDEVEARGSKKTAVENFLETLRIGFTNSSSNRMSRVIGGKQRYFNAPAGVLVAGIGLPAFNPATESRTVRVTMDTLTAESLKHSNALLDSSKESETVALGARLRRLLSLRWPVLRDTLRLVRSLLLQLGHEARLADKYAPLISGYVALTSPDVPDEKGLFRIVELLELAVPQRELAERDADVCLSTLLGRKIAVFTVLGGEKTKFYMTIREVISRVIHGSASERLPLTLQLEHFGVRPMWVKGESCWKLAVCSSEQHDGMRRLMQRTDWALGGWKDVLSRLAGAESCVQKVAKIAQRVVVIDMPPELTAPLVQEVYDFPGQSEVGHPL